ncbi:ABC transporter ATP-binding protein/permease [Myxococcota bacterium]|nr:ABC transporter ATP-binding protein/permease [Myxococcota bacterium]
MPLAQRARNALAVFRQVPPTFRVLWRASPGGTLLLAALTTLGALVPAAIAWVGKLIVDGVVLAAKTGRAEDREAVLAWVVLELVLMTVSTIVTRTRSYLREVVGAELSRSLYVSILEKALALELRHFEDSEVHDKMQNARREAGSRPLELVLDAFAVIQDLITLVAYGALLAALSWWTMLVLVLASVPSFVSEVRLAGDSFRLNSWRAPEGRRLNYLEYILTRDSHVKEVKLFDLGDLVLGRFRALYAKFFAEDRRLARKRLGWGLGLGIVSLAAFYGCYLWVAGRAASNEISLGDMTLYLVVFRQGQAAFQGVLVSIGSMYESALFMSNLFTYLGIPSKGEVARIAPPATIPRGHGHVLELKNVSFRYPGKDAWALRDVSLVIRPGEKIGLVGENGAGKSTLVKLVMRLYEPDEGQILYGGVDVRDLDPKELRRRIGAVFQDAVRYQLSIKENVGLGDVAHVDDLARIERAAAKGGADAVVAELPGKWDTVLGGWFEKGQELSGGQWQKVAVSRGFMREDAEILILDEPAASIDAAAEAELFERLKRLAEHRIAIVISHRFSTVRIADRIAVLHHGRIVELGSHEELLRQRGRYADLFDLQARGYQ